MRVPIIAANWKMNKTGGEAAKFVQEFLRQDLPSGVDILLCPPFTALYHTRAALDSSPRPGIKVSVGAQDMYWQAAGAFTGEVSASMLREAGCEYVIVAHSERRGLFGETDESANKKVIAAFSAGLTPVLCVGETAAERDAGQTHQVIERQVRLALAGLTPAQVSHLVVAYEPVWAIGTGRPASPSDAREAASLIRMTAAGISGAPASESLRVQYGGSVSPSNIGSFMAEPGVDGALVGGAGLDPVSFAGIVRFR